MIQKFTIWNLSPRERFCREESLFSGEVPKCKLHFPLSLGKKEVLHFGIKDFSQGRKKEVLHFGIKDFSQGRKEERSFTFWNNFPREERSFTFWNNFPREEKSFTFWNNFPREERSFTFWN